MGFFDFTTDLAQYQNAGRPRPKALARLNTRRRFLIEGFAEDIQGARVLDLACHDGRWAYAFASAGAACVLGLEARAELISLFDDFPKTPAHSLVKLQHQEIFAGLEDLVRTKQVFDIIAVFGIFYHLMDHQRLLLLLKALGPRLVVIDSEFALMPGANIRLVTERTDKILNAAPCFAGQKIALKGIPSFKAMETMAEVLDYDLTWSDWQVLPQDQRQGVQDYFRLKRLRRATCALRPKPES